MLKESGLRLTLISLARKSDVRLLSIAEGVERVDIDNLHHVRRLIEGLPADSTVLCPTTVRRDLIHILYDFPGFASGITATMEYRGSRRYLKVKLDGVHFTAVDKEG